MQSIRVRRNRRRRIKKARLLAFIILIIVAAFIGKNLVSLIHGWIYRVDYDLVVIGGEPEGVAAAVSAARNGLDVLLVDRHERPGGRLVQSKIAYIEPDHGPDGRMLNQGLFQEFYDQLEGSAFSPYTAQEALESLIRSEQNIERLAERYVVDSRVRRERIVSLTLNEGEIIRASRYIDATHLAEAAVHSGAGFSTGCEASGLSSSVPVSLYMELGGVDWKLVHAGSDRPVENEKQASPDKEENDLEENDLDRNDDNRVEAGQEKGLEDQAEFFILGDKEPLFSEIMREYQALDPDIKIPGITMVEQGNGVALVEAMFIYDVDVLDPESRDSARQRGEREAEFLVRFMRQNVPGFEDAFLALIPSQVNILDTRQLQSLYNLTLDDILEHRDFGDKIALAAAPAYNPAVLPGAKERVLGNPVLYSLPFRSLVPEDLANMLVVGPSAGFEFLAQGSAGRIPPGMSAGQAAGVAAALSLEQEVTFHRFSQDQELVARLQETLLDQGAYLRSFELPYPLKGHSHYPAIKELRAQALVAGGYENDYRLSEPITVAEADEVFYNYLENTFQGRYHLSKVRESQAQVTVDAVLDALKHISGVDLFELDLDELIVRHNFYPGRPLSRGEAYAFLVEFGEILKQK